MERKIRNRLVTSNPREFIDRVVPYARTGVVDRMLSTGQIGIPERGVGKYSLARAVERHNFYANVTVPDDPRQALQERRNRNRALYKRIS